MKDMKRAAQEYGTPEAAMPVSDEYPYGLRIQLGKEELEKLGITELPDVGAVFNLDARAVVKSVRANDSEQGKDYGCELQITHLELETDAGEEASQTATKMYPQMGNGRL